MNIVITGGAGFIGTNLAKYYLENTDAKVTCIDNLYSSSPVHIRQLMRKHGNRISFINENVMDKISLASHVEYGYIYHLACPASPHWYAKDPVYTLMTSVVGTKNVLDLATACNARVLFTSTSEVYGDPDVHPQQEGYNGNVSITGPRACYDEGKRAAETLCADFRRMYGTDVVVARLFNTYGPYMAANDGRVVSNFINQTINGSPITIYGDGSQTRSFCFVKDTVNMLVGLMHHEDSIDYPVNVGNDIEFTMLQLANAVHYSVTGKREEPSIKFCPLPKDDPRIRKPDLGRINSLVPLTGYTTLADGIEATVSYFQQYGELNVVGA